LKIWRGAVALVVGVALTACGPPPPPDPVEGAAVGHVLTQGDQLRSTIGGPGRADGGAVFSVPVEGLEALWRDGPSGGERFELRIMIEGYFQTSAAAVRDAGGDFARLDDQGAFVIDIDAGDHLLCYTRSPGDDVIGPDGCTVTSIPEPPVQLRVWTGEQFSVEQL
jgi:hypothetical protein